MPEVPKAILYSSVTGPSPERGASHLMDSWPTSVWSTVPRLCLYEKGYGEDEYIIKAVDLAKGEVCAHLNKLIMRTSPRHTSSSSFPADPN